MNVGIPSINLVAVGILFGCLQTLFLLSVLILNKKNKKQLYLGSFLAVLLFTQLEAFLNRSGLMTSTLFFLNASTPLVFLFGPLLYLYVRSVLGRPVRTMVNIAHAVPFLFYFGYSFFFFLQPEAYKLNAFINSFQPSLETIPVQMAFSSDPWNIRGIVVVELLSLHILIYATLTVDMLMKFRKAQRQADLKWLSFCTGLLVIGGIVLFLSQGGVINGNRFFDTGIPQFSADLFPTLATYALAIYFLRKGLPDEIKMPKYYKSNISKELRSSQLGKIVKSIEDNQLFTNPNFSLKLLSEVCGISKHHISQVINEEMGVSFFELTNKYRINEAKRRLSTSNEYIKMEQLAYELGYKSKSTFFSAFKRDTNLTPQKYRQNTSI